MRAILEAAIACEAFPGAVLGVAHGGRLLHLGAVGRFTYEAGSAAVGPETAWDLASVSKVVATTAMAMLLWQQGRLDLETPLAALLPGFVADQPAAGIDLKRRVTLRLLLAHASGLPAYRPLYQTEHTPQAMWDAVLRLPLVTEPGSTEAYSDPGFMLLGGALAALAGEDLAGFCAREIFEPLGMLHTRYCPAPAERATIPPTEERATGRVQGVVHDENCEAMGGAAGHAGLFAPAGDVLRFADALLAPHHGRRGGAAGRLFTPEATALFTRRAALPAGSARALGWDTPSGVPSSAGVRFSPRAFGHLGYTGTSLWIDGEADLAVVLLTNRTYPTRENRGIQEVRPRVHDAVYTAVFGP